MFTFYDLFQNLKDALARLVSGKKNVSAEGYSDTRLYVGNLSYQAREDDLRKLFAQHGEVRHVKIVRDRFTRKLKGYAFVEMAPNDVDRALHGVNGNDFLSRKLVVSRAKVRPPAAASSSRPPRRFGGSGSSGGRSRPIGFRPFYAKGCEKPPRRKD
ncbi:MAG: hypothetical protein WCG06_04740 [Candidatus Omnitrophota bacterium]